MTCFCPKNWVQDPKLKKNFQTEENVSLTNRYQAAEHTLSQMSEKLARKDEDISKLQHLVKKIYEL